MCSGTGGGGGGSSFISSKLACCSRGEVASPNISSRSSPCHGVMPSASGVRARAGDRASPSLPPVPPNPPPVPPALSLPPLPAPVPAPVPAPAPPAPPGPTSTCGGASVTAPPGDAAATEAWELCRARAAATADPRGTPNRFAWRAASSSAFCASIHEAHMTRHGVSATAHTMSTRVYVCVCMCVCVCVGTHNACLFLSNQSQAFCRVCTVRHPQTRASNKRLEPRRTSLRCSQLCQTNVLRLTPNQKVHNLCLHEE